MTEMHWTLSPPPRLDWIAVEATVVDHKYQRTLRSKASQKSIARIRDHFDWLRFGAVVLASNGDGTYVVVDGQHRIEAARQRPGLNKVPAVIVEAETLKEQASAFIGVNRDRVNATPAQLFHAHCAAGDADAVALRGALESAGCAIPRTNKPASNLKPGELTCVAALRSACKKFGPDTLSRALSILRDAYPDSGGDLFGQLVRAALQIVARSEDQGVAFDRDRLVATIAAKAGDDWKDEAFALGRAIGLKPDDACRSLIVAAYNRGLRAENRLPWER